MPNLSPHLKHTYEHPRAHGPILAWSTGRQARHSDQVRAVPQRIGQIVPIAVKVLSSSLCLKESTCKMYLQHIHARFKVLSNPLCLKESTCKMYLQHIYAKHWQMSASCCIGVSFLGDPTKPPISASATTFYSGISDSCTGVMASCKTV